MTDLQRDAAEARGPYDVRFEWGLAGAAALAPSSSCLVVVDVLSFSTSVTVAVEAGTRVYPCAWRDETAAAFAREHQAELAVGRRAASDGRPWSLSPAALRRAPFTPRLVLPSPNGSAICASAAATAGGGGGGGGATVIAGCLRNAAAVGRFLHEHGRPGERVLPGERGRPGERDLPGESGALGLGAVAVIAAGERWPDGSLRPALEDLLGAGAVIAALVGCGVRVLSPEAEAARACFEGTADIAAAVAGSVSGRELAGSGFGEDVAIAVESGSCPLVPVLADGAFTAAGGLPAVGGR
jgi:2-phosphosulfolactate phosphatase